MLAALEKKKANTVVTVDLSRLGRNMRESSYYAEEYFPERGIHFFTISDGFDTAQENVFAPFQFAMNEVYLRDGSRKVKNVLKINGKAVNTAPARRMATKRIRKMCISSSQTK